MTTEKFTIKNRHGLKLVIQVDTPDNSTNLVFIAHGQGGHKEQKHIEAFAQAFLENNFRAVRFDATHSIGESEGDIMDVTYTGYIEDLEDVINWARTQSWFQQPYALCGHSMGGTSTCWYAEHHPEEILCVAPLAVVVNFEIYDDYKKKHDPGFMEGWEKRGYFESESRSKPGVVKRVGWGVAEDLKKYDLLKYASKLTMPVLLMAGDQDTSTPYEQQELLFSNIPARNKHIIEVKDAEHSFWSEEAGDKKFEEVKKIISSWLRDINRLTP
jgi:pimeloyl-ACP methyl ester carboxylesterase